MIAPNIAADLLCHVVTIATGLDKTSGTIYAFIRRTSDGFFLKADLSWANSIPVGADVPVATHVAHGIWKFNLPSAQTLLLTPGDFVIARMTDSETPASATVTSDVASHFVDVRAAAAVLANVRQSIAGLSIISGDGAPSLLVSQGSAGIAGVAVWGGGHAVDLTSGDADGTGHGVNVTSPNQGVAINTGSTGVWVESTNGNGLSLRSTNQHGAALTGGSRGLSIDGGAASAVVLTGAGVEVGLEVVNGTLGLPASTAYVSFTSTGDTVLPVVYQVTSPKHTQVRVTFSEPVVMTTGANGALNLANYSIPGLTITNAVSTSTQQVLLTTSNQAPNFQYNLTVTNVEDLQGNPIA